MNATKASALLLLIFTGTALAQAEMGVADRVAFIRTLSAQIVEAKKRSPPKGTTPATSRLVDDAWLGEIKNLEAYCQKRFGKTVWLSPFLPDDATNVERPADGEESVPTGQIKDYRKFKHRAEFVEDRLQKSVIPECK